ncbi:SEL1-like repeat protein [Klebsiella pneumoniae subsp. pneumoniae]|nr:SEL1-like repeat protein [Klebsiella pneumoniae subsp. pneumoniae]
MKMRYVLASGSSAAREIDMNKMKSVICFLALGAISPHAWATPNNDDIKAMLSQAKSGDASAQTQLGILYAEGSGVTRDYKKRDRGLSRPVNKIMPMRNITSA